MPPERPNVLFLMTDQFRFDMTGFAGNEIVRTPNLDRLAEDAVIFDNAYAPSPICMPGRQCMMSGQLPHTCKCYTYGDDLPPNYMTFARRFSQYAYETVCCGKLHHCGVDMYQGWNSRIGYDNGISPRYIEGRIEEEFEKHSGPSQWWPWDKEIRRAGPGRGPYERQDEYAVLGALDHIDEYFCSPWYDRPAGDFRPTLLKVSLRLPHYPYVIDEDKFNYYLNRVEPYLESNSLGHPQLPCDWEKVEAGVSVDEREIRRATAAYYGMVERTDEMFGAVLERLAAVGQNPDDWIIVFTSDHGDMLGQHGLWMKTKFFEGSARVPLMIRWPEKFTPRRVSENVSQCDLFKTLCELCGLETPGGLDSRSLTGLMSGDESGWNNEAVSQFGKNVMIKQGDLKYQYYGEEHPELLFDLAANPEETGDFLNDPAYAAQLAGFRKRLGELGSGPDADPDYLNAGYCG